MQVNSISSYKALNTNFKGAENPQTQAPKANIKTDTNKVLMGVAAASAICAAAVGAIALARKGKTLSLEDFAKQSGQIADDCSAKILNKKGELKDFTGQIKWNDEDGSKNLFRFIKGQLRKSVGQNDVFYSKNIVKNNKMITRLKGSGDGRKTINKTILEDEKLRSELISQHSQLLQDILVRTTQG